VDPLRDMNDERYDPHDHSDALNQRPIIFCTLCDRCAALARSSLRVIDISSLRLQDSIKRSSRSSDLDRKRLSLDDTKTWRLTSGDHIEGAVYDRAHSRT
jgi:hypothetical protein